MLDPAFSIKLRAFTSSLKIHTGTLKSKPPSWNIKGSDILSRDYVKDGHTKDLFVEVGRVSSVTSYITYDDMGAAPGEYYEYRVGVLHALWQVFHAISIF